MKLIEVLGKRYILPWEWNSDDQPKDGQHNTAFFTTPKGQDGVMDFEWTMSERYELVFTINNSTEMTGQGEAYHILATVVDILHKFHAGIPDAIIEGSALGEGRNRVYSRIFKKYTANSSYEMLRHGDDAFSSYMVYPEGVDLTNTSIEHQSRFGLKPDLEDEPPKNRVYTDDQGRPHRLDGPAHIEPDGTERWYKHGQMHRDGAPALVGPDGGGEVWYQNGQMHREDGPAIIHVDGSEYWYQNDQKHRLDGPAVIHPEGTEYWYKNGEQYYPE